MGDFASILDSATTLKDEGKDTRVLHGAAMRAITGKGTTIFAKTSGVTSLDPRSDPVSFDSVFLVASCTKLLTSISAMQCVERGLIKLDEPLDQHLPELCSQPILSEGPEGKFSYRERKVAITLRKLLTHSAGVGSDTAFPVHTRWRRNRGEEPQYYTADVVRSYSLPLLFEPGEGWAYGGGTDWVGKLVERLTLKQQLQNKHEALSTDQGVLEDYFIKNIFEPLEMHSSAFLLARRPDLRTRLVQTVQRSSNPDENFIPAATWHADPPVDCMGGRGLYSTVLDYTAVLQDLLQPTPKLLKKETVDMMFTPQLQEGSAAHKAFKEDVGPGPMNGGLINEGSQINIGLAGLLVCSDNTEIGKVKNTMTWGGKGNLLWFINREANDGEGIAGMFATQLLPDADEKAREIVKGFVKDVWGSV